MSLDAVRSPNLTHNVAVEEGAGWPHPQPVISFRLSIAIAVLAALSLGACTKKGEPAAESKEGLEQALKGVEQAEEGFKRMRERGETLQQIVDEQTKLLDDTIAKHVNLLTTRLNAVEMEVVQMPEEKQAAVRPMLTELKQHAAEVQTAFREYRDAPPEKAGDASGKLKALLEKLHGAFAQMDAKMREPQSPPPVGIPPPPVGSQ